MAPHVQRAVTGRLQAKSETTSRSALQPSAHVQRGIALAAVQPAEPAQRLVVQRQVASGWYFTTGVFNGANLRRDDGTHSVIRKLAKQEVVEVVPKGGRESNFSLPAAIYSPSKEHSWVRTAGGQLGWVEDAELRVTERPHGSRAYSEILAEEAEARRQAEEVRRAEEVEAARRMAEEAERRRQAALIAARRLVPRLTITGDELSNDRDNKMQVNAYVDELLGLFAGANAYGKKEALLHARSKLSEHRYLLSGNQYEVDSTAEALVESAVQKGYPMNDAVAGIIAKIAIPLSFLGISGSYMADRKDADSRR